jgi:hypothetical protein
MLRHTRQTDKDSRFSPIQLIWSPDTLLVIDNILLPQRQRFITAALRPNGADFLFPKSSLHASSSKVKVQPRPRKEKVNEAAPERNATARSHAK